MHGSLACRTVAIILSLFLAACGGGSKGQPDAGDGGDLPCDLVDNPCPAGQRCSSEQACLDAEDLVIITTDLPTGRVSFAYDQPIEAEGGLTPYTWSIAAADASLAFLEIGADGHLRGTAPAQVSDGALTVAVTDSGFGGGERVEKTFSISFDLCRDGDAELCYIAADGVCYQGARTCSDGQMGECEASANPSADKNQCGPECGRCDSAVADACFGGVCACGEGALCGGGDRCCDGQCLDVNSNDQHCGMCFNDCEQAVAHATEAEKSCSGGICDYLGECDYGYLDCDGQRNNGCEKPMRLDTCGACDVDCNADVAHVQPSQKVCRDTGSAYVCDFNGDCASDFDDCDLDGSNGCETWLNDEEHCGACGENCAQSAVGSLCISPDFSDPFFHACGCEFDSLANLPVGCVTGMLCCSSTCTDTHSADAHCGVCPASCTVGACVDGACGCSTDADCPVQSTGTSCGQSGRCVCAHAGGGQAACGVGFFCCDGNAGGSGGPQGEADVGCCPKRCGQNNAEENFACTP